jgi:hypothetical protein
MSVNFRFDKTTDRRHRFVVAFCTVTFAASVPQKVTAVAPAKLVPVIVTLVPPAAAPELGLTLVKLRKSRDAAAHTGCRRHRIVRDGAPFASYRVSGSAK